jgi:hypothetical protein
VRKIVYEVAYADPIAQELLAEAGVSVMPFASLEGLRQ